MPLPRLTRSLAASPDFQRRTDLLVPSTALLELPEKAVQFGTGALLRGFVDYFIDAANRRGEFNGRIVAVGSTGSGRDGRVNEQDGLFTLVISGIEEGVAREERRVIASVSRALSARGEWAEVLECARNPDLELVFSNTTEVGIALDESDSPDMSPPRSFPGKLAAFLHARATAFGFDPLRGLIVLPCELIENNGEKLREIVTTLATRWNLGPDFLRWLDGSVTFCNTLVDRIVPGTPSAERLAELERTLGYQDELATACESYRLFAIEGDQNLAARLGFAGADPGIVIASSIAPYRLRKVRLLNGTHTIMAPVALLAGCETVLDAMRHEMVSRFIRRAMLEEIVPTLDVPSAASFARETLDRFANPSIRHALIDITLHATTKMRVRIIPSILAYAERNARIPESLAFGFAAWLLFMRGDLQRERQRAGLTVPADDASGKMTAIWKTSGADHRALVRAACADESLWGTDLTAIPGFAESVAEHLAALDRDGAASALDAHLSAVSST
jgi:tagaturonate reductase